MKKITAIATAAVLVSSLTAYAGGPVVVVEESDPVAVGPVSSFGSGAVVAGLAALLLVAAAASSSSSSTTE